jgi:hypothetical protein
LILGNAVINNSMKNLPSPLANSFILGTAVLNNSMKNLPDHALALANIGEAEQLGQPLDVKREGARQTDVRLGRGGRLKRVIFKGTGVRAGKLYG